MSVQLLRILGATSQNCKWFFLKKNWRRVKIAFWGGHAVGINKIRRSAITLKDIV
jgi:hypothetical protein